MAKCNRQHELFEFLGTLLTIFLNTKPKIVYRIKKKSKSESFFPLEVAEIVKKY